MKLNSSALLEPNWPAPKNVCSYVTTRKMPMLSEQKPSLSKSPYDQFNLATHVDDDEEQVLANRVHLQKVLEARHANSLSYASWLDQIHSDQVIQAEDIQHSTIQADAIFTRQTNLICLVQTADCLPVLMTNKQGSFVAAAHAGWRGLASGILENTIAALNDSPENLLIWFGPAIGPTEFEVGGEVFDIFVQQNSECEKAFQAAGEKWIANIYLLARIRLEALGISHIYGGDFCTVQQSDQFYSYRRDGVTGRMASLIWLADQ